MGDIGWFPNVTHQTCGEVYLQAYNVIKSQLGLYLVFFAITIVIQAIVVIYYEKRKLQVERIDTQEMALLMTTLYTTTALQLFWIFNLVGLYYFGI